VRNFIAVFSIVLSSACSLSNDQLREADVSAASISVENPAISSVNKTVNNKNALHTSMSPVSSATAIATMKQQLRADPQWNALANEVVYCLTELKDRTTELKERAIFVARLENPSAELKAFRSMIMTKLVQNGFKVTFNTRDALYLKYDIIKKDSADETMTDMVVHVAVINGEKVMTHFREVPALADIEKQKKILRFVKKQ